MRHKTKQFYLNRQDPQLFDTDEFVKRPTPDQNEFASLLLDHINNIKQAIYAAEVELQSLHEQYPPHYFSTSLDAHFFNRFVVGKLKNLMGYDHFGETPEGRSYMKLGKYIVYIKKLNSNFEPSNIPTNNTQRINAQYATSTEDPKAVIYLGYMGSGGDLCNIAGIYAVYIDTDKRETWRIDLNILQRITQNITEIPTTMTNQDTEPRVKVRKVLEEVI